jgi:hypothetical protein
LKRKNFPSEQKEYLILFIYLYKYNIYFTSKIAETEKRWWYSGEHSCLPKIAETTPDGRMR